MKRSKLVVNVISSRSGGGAEFLVRAISAHIQSDVFDHETIYFNFGSMNNVALANDEHVFSISSRNPLVIFLLRRYLIAKLKVYDQIIVHAHLTWPFYYTALATLGLNVKLVYTEHHTSNKRRHILFLRYFERYVYSRYQLIICISTGVRQSLINWIGHKFSDKLFTVPNGARLLNYVPREPIKGRKVNLVSVGRLVPEKGFDMAIRAISDMKGLVESYNIVGDGPEKSHLGYLIEQHELDKIVHLVGWSDQVEKYFIEADIQLVPSTREGFGIVAIEGMSTGLPVIASNIPGLDEAVNSEITGSLLVNDFRKHAEWAAHIRLMAENLNFSGETFASASRTHAENFSILGMVDKYRNLYLMVFKDESN